MSSYEEFLKVTFGYTESYEFGVVKDLERDLGPADEGKIKLILETLCSKKNVVALYGLANQMMMEAMADQGQEAVLKYLKILGFSTINSALRKAAKLIQQES